MVQTSSTVVTNAWALSLISNNSIQIERGAQMDTDVPKTGIYPIILLRSPDLSITEPRKGTLSHSGFHEAKMLLKKN